MSLRHNLLQARSHIAIILGFLIAFGVVLYIENRMPSPPVENTALNLSHDFPTLPAPRALTFEEAIWARVAWQYFINNTQPSGLVNAIDNQPYTSMWDSGSYLMAVISAQRLGIISRTELNSRMSNALAALGKLPLYQGRLPAVYYDTLQLDMLDTPSLQSAEPGWSAVDISRIVMPLNISVWLYPEQTAAIHQLLRYWQLDALFAQQLPQSPFSLRDVRKWQLITRDNRPGYGYQLYAAQGLQNANAAAGIVLSQPLPKQRYITIEGVEIPYDGLIKVGKEDHPIVVSMPYILTGLEAGFDINSAEMAWRIVKVQESRYKSREDFTYLSNDYEEQKPAFSGKLLENPLSLTTDTSRSELKHTALQLSTRSVFGWHALFPSPWSESMRRRAIPLLAPGKGWYDGIRAEDQKLSTTLSANTNAMVLESLLYLTQGPLLCPSCQSDIPQNNGSNKE
ncbi:TPA: DUF3131 domain-containing protein [Serratia fonticola]